MFMWSDVEVWASFEASQVKEYVKALPMGGWTLRFPKAAATVP